MPLTNLFLHKIDRDTLQRMPVLPPFVTHTLYTYTIDAVAILRTLGITWDGASLWVCTEGNAARGVSPRLIQLDPSIVSTTASPTQIIATNLPAGFHLRDIAWHGAGFYGIVDTGGFTPEYWLVDLDPTGTVNRILSTALLAGSQGIAWDGSSIYISVGFTVLALIQEWDPQAAVAMRVTVVQLGPTAPGALGPGLAWDGAYFHTKVRGSVPLVQIEYQVNWPDPAGSVHQAVRSVIQTAYPTVQTEKLTLTWDGAFIWTFASLP